MNTKNDIKILLLKEEMTIKALAEKMSTMGRKISRSGLSQKLSRGTLRYDELLIICKILDYELNYKKNI
jgi:hypothetical protein